MDNWFSTETPMSLKCDMPFLQMVLELDNLMQKNKDGP